MFTASACLLLWASPASAHPAAQPVISQVYGGGGNVGAPYQNDFIELFNRKGAPLDLTGYSVQYAPAGASSVWTVTPLSGTLAIGQYLLVAEGNSGLANGSPLPTADATGSTDMSLVSGKVALVPSFTPLPSGGCPTALQVLDLVGYGTAASCFEGAGPTANTTNLVGARRNTAGCTDTNNNAADFALSSPVPARNRLTAKNFCFAVPAVPTVSATNPTSPSNSLTPNVIGSAPAGTSVELYTNPSCSGSAVATGTAAQFASPGIATTVAANSTTTFYASAFDANNTSDCSTTSVTYVEDAIAPPAPTLIASTPASPSNDISPKIKGSAADATTVKLYTSASCAGAAVATGTAAQFASPGITTTVAADSTTTFFATATDAAGNVSPCSTSSLTYIEDSTPPVAPTLSSSVPASPANSTTPKIVGSAEPGSTVKLYTDAACTNLAATGTAAQFASSGISVTVAANSTTTFRATATDAVNNVSPCSTSTLTYVEDANAPAAPTLSSSVPASPANNTTPKIVGSAEAGSILRLYTDAACTNLAATGTAAQFASPGITVTVAANSTTTFYGTATDAVNNTSACSSSSLTYVEDSSAPTAPTLSSSVPASPANNNNPQILGSAEAGSTVRLYGDAACTTLAGTGTAAQFASPGVTVTVPPDSTTTFHATATDAVGNTSACSSSSLTYVEDSTAPTAPTLSSSAPASPANNTTPKIIGSAETGSTVRLYTDAACTNLAATGTAAQFSAPGITVTVAANSTTTFYGTATDAVNNVSPCSASSLTYIEDSAAPTAPTLSSSTPASPANNTTPKILGSAEAGSIVRLYTDAACTNLAATGTAAQFSAPGITVTVAANSTTTFYGTATDAVNNVSPCSASSLTYIEDSAAPTAPTLSSSTPASPANNTTPKIVGSAEPGSTVNLYSDAACTTLAGTGTAAQFASPGITVTVTANSTTTFHATATDAVGNTSACSSSSLTYVEDSTAPASPVFTSSVPPSPANDTTPDILGSAEPGSTVKLYSDAACTTLVGTGTAAQFASPGITVTVAANSTTTLHATATDAVGNISPCSSSTLTYEEDSSLAAEPTFGSSVPSSPANDTTPSILGSAEAGSTVKLYTDAACTNLAGSGTAAQFASPGITIAVPPNSTTTFHATATDMANNVSPCSTSSLTYVEDSAAPTSPVFTSSVPPSPANDTTPQIRGSAEAGSTVKLYTDAACTNLAATGTAAQFAAPGITVTVAADSTTTFHATATDAVGNTSACSSSSLTYVEDSGLPGEPTFSSSVPASPANDTTPNIIGSAEAGSTVKLYTDAACANLAATGTAAQFAAAGIAVTVAANSSTNFYATATDPVNNVSPCSTSSLNYVEDSTAPAAPTLDSTVPASPSSDTSPKIVGSAEAGSTVKLYTDAACTNLAATGTAAQLASTGITGTVAPSSTTTFYATATDAAGNTSPCSVGSVTYVQAPDQQVKGPAPVISGLYLSPRRFATNLKRTPVGAAEKAAKSGSTIHFTLSEQARVSFTILRRPPRAQRPGPSGSPVKTFGRLLGPGENLVPFSGRLGNRIFRTGPYRLYATAIDSDGLISEQASAPFRILPR